MEETNLFALSVRKKVARGTLNNSQYWYDQKTAFTLAPIPFCCLANLTRSEKDSHLEQFAFILNRSSEDDNKFRPEKWMRRL